MTKKTEKSLVCQYTREFRLQSLDDESDLLRDDPEAKALLRNTALNSFGPEEHVSEKAIEKKIKDLRQKERAHLDMVNIQRYPLSTTLQTNSKSDT